MQSFRSQAVDVLDEIMVTFPRDDWDFFDRNRGRLLDMLADRLAQPPVEILGFHEDQWTTGGKWVKGTFPVRGRQDQYALHEGVYKDGIGLYASYLYTDVVLYHGRTGKAFCFIPLQGKYKRKKSEAMLEARELTNYLLKAFPGFELATTKAGVFARVSEDFLAYVNDYVSKYQLNIPVLLREYKKRQGET